MSFIDKWKDYMVSINVSNDVDKVIKLLDFVRLKQLPFATSLAINNTAK